MFFVGVSTGGSSILQLFPVWAQILELDARIEGRDIAIRADPAAFRGVTREVAAEPDVRGALVTTHKVDVYEHARDLFAELDEYARVCKEISCISKRGGGLVGHAKDPITAGRSLRAMLGDAYWSRTGADVLCLGAGGAGTAISVRLLTARDRPGRIVLADRDDRRLETLREIHCGLDGASTVEYVSVASPADNDALLASLRPRSLVVNATGLGKDLPGSPITDAAVFPEAGVVWELNYRGELDFLHQAARQARARRLELHDGWTYFLHGWTEVVAEVFALELDDALFGRLARAADAYKPAPPLAG